MSYTVNLLLSLLHEVLDTLRDEHWAWIFLATQALIVSFATTSLISIIEITLDMNINVCNDNNSKYAWFLIISNTVVRTHFGRKWLLVVQVDRDHCVVQRHTQGNTGRLHLGPHVLLPWKQHNTDYTLHPFHTLVYAHYERVFKHAYERNSKSRCPLFTSLLPPLPSPPFPSPPLPSAPLCSPPLPLLPSPAPRANFKTGYTEHYTWFTRWHYAIHEVCFIMLSTYCTTLTLARATLACGVSVWSCSEQALSNLWTKVSEASSPEGELRHGLETRQMVHGRIEIHNTKPNSTTNSNGPHCLMRMIFGWTITLRRSLLASQQRLCAKCWCIVSCTSIRH